MTKRILFITATMLTFAMSASYAQEPPPEVILQARGHGWLMTDANGMVLYTYTRDQEPGKSFCDEECTEIWPPLAAPDSANGDGGWSTIVREDGSLQWAFRGKPLYTYSRDRAPMDMNGDGFNNRWYLALKPIPTPSGFDLPKTAHGVLLVGDGGMALYTSDKDPEGKSVCGLPCIWTWEPVIAPWLSRSPDENWTLITREDGTKQWAYKGKALYRYSEDFVRGRVAGNGIEGRSVVVLDPPPSVPSWVTVQPSDGGEIYADPDGKTLYAHDTTRRAGNVIQRPMDWIPVLATPADKPVGQWSIVEREDGSLQWIHKGLLLYTNIRDTRPGQLDGVRSIDRVWRPLLTNGQTMPGTGA